MKQDATSDPNATQTASPSTAEPASTIEPTPGARPTHHRPSAASQLRDPDRYQIINEHGRGGLGRVSRAHDRDLGRDVAIKELISRGTLSEVRFLREALITARLEHPGIVPVHEAGRWPDGTPFYAMKLVAGRPLRDLIQERTTVAERIGLLHHVIAVADAIAYAHGRNIIHRDLKPANVIVGDFGETIVIDWGLAKDLSTASEATLGGGPFRANRDDDLTAVGSVLGTPAYMAPEQERGEYVDQRADVFAIGAMLWELCSLQKVPPSDQQLRHRLLRRAAIDQDLVTIIDKSLDPDPTRRYPNAGALAADLKAFKAGARISARSYSLAAMFAHWIRRRRGAAIAIACVLGILLAGAALYVRNINIERGLADAAKATADNANTVTTIALAEQTLGHAEVLLSSDPSAANDLLNSYKGKDDFRLGMLRAQANGLGVARLRATPNTDSVLWIHVLQDQSLATLSNDGSVAVTTATGAVRIIKHEAGARSVWTFSESRQLLAYVCSENQICLIDFSHASPSLAGRLNYSDPEGLAFSPDSKRLAIVSRTEHLEVWDLSKLDIPFQLFRARAHGFNASFIDIDTLVAVDEQTSTIISGSRITNTIPTPDASNTASSIEHNAIAIGTGRGMAIMIRRELKPTIIPVKLCDGPLKTLAFTSDANIIAYGCKDGRIGLWHVDSLILDPLTVVPGGISELAVSWDSRYLAVGGNSGALSIVSLDSGIITRCLGHSGRISAIEPLVRDGLFASGDFNGNIRIWDKPLSLGRVAYIAKSRLIDVQFLFDSSALVTTGVDTAIRFVSDKSTQNVASHGPNNKFLAVAPGGHRFASYGSQTTIEIWSSSAQTIEHTIDTDHSETVQLRFITPDALVYATSSGRVSMWTAASGRTSLAEFSQPVANFVLLQNDILAVELRDGTLWKVERSKAPVHILLEHTPGGHILNITTDRRWLVLTSDSGDVTIYDTDTWTAILNFHGAGSVHHAAVSPNANMVAIAMKSGELHLGFNASSENAISRTHAWQRFSSHPRFITFSPSGDLMMLTTGDGVIWFYSTRLAQWLYFPTGSSGLTVLRVSSDGRRAATVESNGKLIVIDLELVRNTFTTSTDHTLLPMR